MKKILLGLLVCSSTLSFATTSKPRNPNDKPVRTQGVSIGKFETNLKLVHRFMDFVKWDANTEYEETGHKMESLLLKLVNKNIEKKWFEEVVVYSQSAEFLSQDQNTKGKDIFEAKMYAKMIINDSGLLK